MKIVSCLAIVLACLAACDLFGSSDPAALTIHPPPLVNAPLSEDAGDGGVTDITFAEFSGMLTATFMTHYQCCCGVDDAHWRQAYCTGVVDGVGGFQAKLGKYADFYSGGHLSLNQSFAHQCLTIANELNCTAVSGTEAGQWWSACFGAIRGDVNLGGACADDSECGQGYCNTGTCVPFVAVAGLCTKDEACSRLGMDGAFCSAGHCKGAVANGVLCHDNGVYGNNQCESKYCGEGALCKASLTLESSGICPLCTLP